MEAPICAARNPQWLRPGEAGQRQGGAPSACRAAVCSDAQVAGVQRRSMFVPNCGPLPSPHAVHIPRLPRGPAAAHPPARPLRRPPPTPDPLRTPARRQTRKPRFGARALASIHRFLVGPRMIRPSRACRVEAGPIRHYLARVPGSAGSTVASVALLTASLGHRASGRFDRR